VAGATTRRLPHGLSAHTDKQPCTEAKLSTPSTPLSRPAPGRKLPADGPLPRRRPQAHRLGLRGLHGGGAQEKALRDLLLCRAGENWDSGGGALLFLWKTPRSPADHTPHYKQTNENTANLQEVLAGLYDERADVWSCGVVLHALLAARLPFGGRTQGEVMDVIRSPERGVPDL
jgi:hypothetical protein